MTKLTRRGLLGSVALPAAAGWALQVRAEATDPFARPLLDLYAALETAMRSGHTTPFPRRFDAVEPVVDQVFDLQTVLKVSVGLRWNSMRRGVQTRLLNAYRRFTVATYVASFDRYDGERFRILPGARAAGVDRIVDTEIIRGGEQRRLDYVMREGNGTWRAVDVLLEGSISRVAVQRSDFRTVLANGDSDALIASLQRKIADLSGGALNS
jgi:phospholipid transport system substrate-binding protein